MLKNVFLFGSIAMIEWARRFCFRLNYAKSLLDLREYDILNDMQV